MTKRIIFGVFCVLAAVIAVLVGLTVYAFIRDDDKPAAEVMAFDPSMSPLEFFQVDDALQIKWYHGANSKKQLSEALTPQGGYMMLEADIILRFQGLPNQTDQPVMGHPPVIDSDHTLDEWLDSVIAAGKKGMKLDFKSLDVIAPSLKRVSDRRGKLKCPVWVNADIAVGPGGGSPINHTEFIKTVNKTFDDVTISVGWTTGCCSENFGRGVMDDMWEMIKGLKQPVSISARAALLRSSWPQFRWLLEKSERFTMTVWTPAGNMEWEGASPYDLLYVRNDWSKERIYYDLPGPKFTEFKTLAKTAGSAQHHFNIKDRDAAKITWAHAVNNKQYLLRSLKGPVMFLEADVMLDGQGTANQTNVPIMAHPPNIHSDITLEQWLDEVAESSKGIKLDFKSLESVEPSLKLLKLKYDESKLNQPVWLNADILIGPNTVEKGRNATEFLKMVDAMFPQATLSIGWTTAWTNSGNDTGYTMKMVKEMNDLAIGLRQPVTFPIRAAAARQSWKQLDWLLNQSRGYTLTIWHGSADSVKLEDMIYIRSHSKHSRVYFDVPDKLMPI